MSLQRLHEIDVGLGDWKTVHVEATADPVMKYEGREVESIRALINEGEADGRDRISCMFVATSVKFITRAYITSFSTT